MLRKIFRIILALTIPVGTILTLIVLFANTRGWYTPTTKDDFIKVVEGNETYMIPANYIWSGRDKESALSGQVNFHMLYPGAEPQTKKNKKEFDSRGWAGGRLVTFILMPKRGMHFLEHYREVETKAREKNQISNLGDWRQMPLGIEGRILLKKESADSREIYITCSIPTKYVKNPDCNKYFALTDSTYVYFSFSRDRLDEWQRIETEITALMNKFRTKNQSGKI